MTLNQVRPGDLIDAASWNNLLAEINALNTRVTQLEGGISSNNPLQINEIVPPDTLMINQEIQVLGQGFAPANHASDNIVTMGGRPVERFLPGTGPTKLVFNVPTIPGVPRDDVVLMVRYQNSNASRVVSVASSVVIPTGRLVITDVTTLIQPPGQINIGGTYTFWFELDSQTLPAGETYQLSFNYSNAIGANITDWNTSSHLVNASGGTLVSNLLQIELGQPVRIGVNFTVPAGAASVNLRLSARSRNNDSGLSTAFGPIPITVGVAQDVPDPRVTFVPQAFAAGAAGRLSGQGFEVPYSGLARLGVLAEMLATAPANGHYRFTATLEPDNGSWQLTNPSPSAPVFVNAGHDQLFEVNARLNTSADSGGGHPEGRTLVVTVEQIDGTVENRFRSWRRIPIQGYTP